MKIPVKAKSRLTANVKKYQKILVGAQDRDINESDTVTIVVDILHDVFGYDKFSEITSEYAIRGTYCDLAILRDDKPAVLIEVKAVGITLGENQMRQALGYGSGEGVEWIILTNGLKWLVYRIVFEQPVRSELVYAFNFSDINPRVQADIEMLYPLCKESILQKTKSNPLDELWQQKQVLNKYVMSQVLLTEPVLIEIRRLLKKMGSGNLSTDEVAQLLLAEVIKRDALDDDEKVKAAQKEIRKALKPPKPSK